MPTLRPASPEVRKHAHRLWWALSVVGVLLVVALGWVFLYDGPAPDDEKWVPHWTQRPAHQNPLVTFFRELDEALLREYESLPLSVRKGEAGGDSAIRDFVAKQERTYAAFDKLMESDVRSWQWPAGEKLADLYTGGTEPGRCGAVAQVVNVKVRALTLDGKTEEAFDLSLKLARFGSGLLRSEGSLIHALVGLTVQRIGESGLEKSLSGKDVSPELLRRCFLTLQHVEPPRREDIQFAYQVDYLAFRNALIKMNRWQLGSTRGKPTVMGSMNDLLLGCLFKPNRTLTKWTELEQPLIEGLHRGWIDGRDALSRSRGIIQEQLAARNRVSLYLSGNSFGTNLIGMSTDASGTIIDKAMANVVLHGQSELMLALRLFELERRELPRKLDELAPAYLPAIPEDVFAGKPMLWDREKQVIYSVGPNGTDEGGAINPAKVLKGEDLGMRYWWSETLSAKSVR